MIQTDLLNEKYCYSSMYACLYACLQNVGTCGSTRQVKMTRAMENCLLIPKIPLRPLPWQQRTITTQAFQEHPGSPPQTHYAVPAKLPGNMFLVITVVYFIRSPI